MSESCTISSDLGPRCPFCGNTHCDADDWDGVVSFWGADSSVEYTCNGCELTFLVMQNISRAFLFRAPCI